MGLIRVAAMIGVVSLFALTAFAQEVAGGAPGKHKGWLAADTNGDGKVSFEELSKLRPQVTRERFAKLDRNGDGVLSKADREAARPAEQPAVPKPRPGAGAGAAPIETVKRADANQDGSVTFEELAAANPGASRERFDRLDRNHDGVLTKADAPAPQSKGQRGSGQDRAAAAHKLFDSDANKDGKVTYEELLAAKPGFPREAFDRYDSNKDGVVSDADAAGGRVANAPGSAQARPEFRQRMQAADTNGDGRVSFEEAQKAFPRMAPERFKQLDRNGDGFLSKDDRSQNA